MELNHLRYFHAVAREGSFTRAAKVLRVQQPTISKMVRHLEGQLNVVLLERHKRGVRLTSGGGEIFRICEEIFAGVDQIRAISESENRECQGVLSFGMTDSATIYVLPGILRGFLAKHPKVRPSIFAGSSNLITSEIKEGRVEFGVYFTRPDPDGLAITELMQVPFQLVVASSHAASKSLRSRFIISRDIDYPKARPFPVLELLRRAHIKVDTMVASNNLESQKQMVLEGMGVALLPGFMVKADLARGALTALHPRHKFAYSLKLVTQSRRVLSRNALVFLEDFKRELAGML
jgi:DNA-binding transcriptional LysR family regulator